LTDGPEINRRDDCKQLKRSSPNAAKGETKRERETETKRKKNIPEYRQVMPVMTL